MTTPGAGIVVTMRHVRAAGLCAPGVRRWFTRFDRTLIRRFCREGLPVEEVDAFGDPLSQRVARQARIEHERTTRG